MTTAMIASANAQFACKSGTQYTADANGKVAVTAGDVLDMLNMGALLAPASDSSAVLPWVAGQVYGAPPGSTREAVLTVTGTIYAYPIFVPNPVSVKTISINSTTGQTGGAAHAAIYGDNAGYPGAYVAGSDSGALAATATAVATKTYTAPIALSAGWYWLASIFTASSTFPSVMGIKTLYTGTLSDMLGYDTIAHAMAVSGQAGTGISVAGTYGAFSAGLFPVAATLTLNADTPFVALGL